MAPTKKRKGWPFSKSAPERPDHPFGKEADMSAVNLIRANSNRRREKAQADQKQGIADGFTQYPNRLLLDPTITGNEKALYGALLAHDWGRGECWPSRDLLAAYLGVTPRQISNLLASLKRKGLIRVDYRPGRPSLYHPEFWVAK